MKMFLNLTRAGLLSFARDKTAVFWSFFFPLFFIIIFGSIFSRSGSDGPPKFSVRIVMNDDSPSVNWVPGVFENVPVLSSKVSGFEEARSDLESGKARAIVVIPKDFSQSVLSQRTSEVIIYTDPSQPAAGQAAAGIVREVLSGMERRMTGAPTLIKTTQKQLTAKSSASKDGDSQNGINFLLPGILTMTIVQLGLFTAIPIINLREKGILKRLRATPLPRSAIVFSQVAQRLVVAVAQTSVLIGVGALAFGFRITGSPILVALWIVFGVLTFVSVGAVLASVAKTTETGMALVQLINFPMMFLSGLFFPLEFLKGFLHTVSTVMPATYFADLMRHLMTGAALAFPVWVNVSVLGGWMIVALLVASRLFKWD